MDLILIVIFVALIAMLGWGCEGLSTSGRVCEQRPLSHGEGKRGLDCSVPMVNNPEGTF